MTLTPQEMERYTRHLVIEEIGTAGQERLKQASALILGTGGLGSPIAYYLAAAGFGRLGIVDDDQVSLSNLNRQILHTTADIGRPKVVSAKEKLEKLNPELIVDAYQERVCHENVLELVKKYDMVVDGTDNFASRYIINDACVKEEKPYIFGAINKFIGQVTTVMPGQGPCFRCLFPEGNDPDQATRDKPIGVFGFVPGVIGTLEACEAVKLALGVGENLIGRLLVFDALTVEFREIIIEDDPECPICGNN